MGVGGFATGQSVGGTDHDATPAAGTPMAAAQPLGYASLRVRQLSGPAFRVEVNEIVTSEFVAHVQALPGYRGYLLGDIVEHERQSLSVVAFEEVGQIEAFNAAAQEFVGGLDPKYGVETPTAVEGDVLIAASSLSAGATPVADGAAAAGGYVAVRIYTSSPGTDPRAIAPLVASGFLPIVQGLPGFQGYLFFLAEGGFTSISFYDAEASAQESTVAAGAWVAENVIDYVDGNPRVINALTVFADLPILPGAG